MRVVRSLLSLMCIAASMMIAAPGCTNTNEGRACEGADAPPMCNEACSSDMDCGQGLYCDDGRCSADCTAGGDQCLEGYRCDERGRCAQVQDPPPCQGSDPPATCGEACQSDADCFPDAYCGADGVCTADCSATGDQCDQGMVCTSAGRCIKTGGPDCPDVTIDLKPVIPQVMILIDQSGSMTEAFGQVGGQNMNRWEAVRYALTDAQMGAVTKLQSSVLFAATLYHSKGGFQGGTCPILTQSSGTGVPKLNNRQAIDSLLANNDPIQDTPTAESIDAVVKEMKAWTGSGPDVQPGPKVLVLATDGDPDNCNDPNAHDATSQKMSETAVQDAFKAGIQTYALSVGSDVSEAHLARVANAGLGKPLDPPSAPFFRGNNPAELVAAFDEIIRGVRECLFTLDQAVEPQYAKAGKVTLNGSALTWGTDWELKDPKTLELKGKACQTFIDSDVVQLEATFPCGAVIE